MFVSILGAAGFLQFLRSYENHFPGSADKIIMINGKIKSLIAFETEQLYCIFWSWLFLSLKLCISIIVAPLFEFVLQVVRSTVSPQTREAMHVFGKNKPLWQKYVLEFIEKKELTPEYGGTRET